MSLPAGRPALHLPGDEHFFRVVRPVDLADPPASLNTKAHSSSRGFVKIREQVAVVFELGNGFVGISNGGQMARQVIGQQGFAIGRIGDRGHVIARVRKRRLQAIGIRNGHQVAGRPDVLRSVAVAVDTFGLEAILVEVADVALFAGEREAVVEVLHQRGELARRREVTAFAVFSNQRESPRGNSRMMPSSTTCRRQNIVAVSLRETSPGSSRGA